VNKDNIKIIQNILKKQSRYELAIKLENAYYDYSVIEAYDGWEKICLEVFVHPNYFLELKVFENDIALKELFMGLFTNVDIASLEFKINTDEAVENISDTVYIFVDEAGDMDFSAKGSQHYMFNFLVKRRPFNLHQHISNYRYTLLERNLNPLNGSKLDIEAFHAHKDNKYVRNELFNIISAFEINAVKTYSYILEKPKVAPEKRQEKDKFYIDNLSYSIQILLDKLEINKNFIIITDRLPVQKNKNKQIGALKKGIKEYLKVNNLDLRYDIFHHVSASSTNLQIIDYLSWAVFRKFEHKDDSYFKRIEKYLIGLDVMTKDRKEVHYEK